jgi:hypothetical protein
MGRVPHQQQHLFGFTYLQFLICNYKEGIGTKFLWPSTDLSFLPLPIWYTVALSVATKTTPVAIQLSRRIRITACLALTVRKPGINRYLAKKLCFSCVRRHCSSFLAPQNLVLPYSLCFLFYQRVPKICRQTGDVTSVHLLANLLRDIYRLDAMNDGKFKRVWINALYLQICSYFCYYLH